VQEFLEMAKKTCAAKIKEKRQKKITAKYEATAPVVEWF